jgi:hypothetical protein
MRQRSVSQLVIAALILAAACPVVAYGQAFTPPKGEGSVTFLAQDTLVRHHYFTTTEVDRGHIRLQSFVWDVNYGVTDKLAIGVAMPYVRAKYYGTAPHPALPGAKFLDDERYHGSAQDLRFDVRYNLTRDRVVLTPYVAVIVPTHDYVFLAHSAVGRQLREVQVGVYAARLLDPLLPNAFVQVRYAHGIPERTLNIRPNRSNLDLEVGYFVNESLRVFAMGMGQITHRGIDTPPPGGSSLANPLFVHHDQIGRENALKIGAGAALTLTDRVDVFASALKTVDGRNGHSFAYNITTGVTVSFGGRRRAPTAAPSAGQLESEVCHLVPATDKENSLAKCVCIKGS